MTGFAKGLRDDQQGTALVEAAVAIPLVLLLLLGLIDFGRAYYTLATAQKSTRNAVRYLTTLPPSTICGWGFIRAKNLARFGNIDGTGDRLVKDWGDTQITLTAPDCKSAVTSASIVEMQADVPFSPLVWPVIGLPSTMTLKVDYKARWIGE